jgi:hypothetical protein
MSSPAVVKQTELKLRYEHLHGKKSGILTECEKYAGWTLPYVFPKDTISSTQTEFIAPADPIGAACVNHLSNKTVTTLFPPQASFFRLLLDEEMKSQIEATLKSNASAPTEDAQAELNALMLEVEAELAKSERKAIDYLDMVAYRPQLIHAAKLLIITGNALEYHPPGKPVQVYTLRDYCTVRDLSGQCIEIMTRETKAFETFHPDVQRQLKDRKVSRSHSKDYADKDEVTIYTQVKLQEDGKWHVYQAADLIALDTSDNVWPTASLPWVPLTWNLVRGEDYGRGLVAEYGGAFHAIEVFTNALMNIAAIMGDIKFLVNPSSNIDVKTLNDSPPGSYHAGRDGDITTAKFDRTVEAQFLVTMIERSEQQISKAFLLLSASRRQGERVTAEEIRGDANELETSNGGIYSRLAATWQVPVAHIALDQTKFQGVQAGIRPKVITGMDSLSRVSELDNLRMFMADLTMLAQVPETFQAAIHPDKFMALIGTNRQVEYKQFVKTPAEMQADRDAAAAENARLVEQQTAGKVAEAAGTAAVQE